MIVGYVEQILGRGPVLPLHHPWAAPKKPILNGVYDLLVLGDKLSCEALSLIDKVMTEPLWRTMLKEKEVVGMFLHYQKMYHFFKKCSTDPSLFVDGRNLLFP